MADTSVATANTLSNEATLILLTLHVPSPTGGLVDSLIWLQSRSHNGLNTTIRLWFAGHTLRDSSWNLRSSTLCGVTRLRCDAVGLAPTPAPDRVLLLRTLRTP